jgi:hypothetical protein
MTILPNGEFLYPRLPRAAAVQLLREREASSLEALAAQSEIAHISAAPNAVGGKVASESQLQIVRQLVRDLAADFGFPGPLSPARQAAFDRECGTILYSSMGILTADAGSDEVWSFLTLVLLPELSPWRFPSRLEERQIGGVRNALQRLWWRAWSLGPDLTWVPQGAIPFGEDDYVQVMERPRIGRNQRVARALQLTVWRTDHAAQGLSRSALMRQLTVRLLAQRSHIALDALSTDELGNLLERLAIQSIAAVIE